MDFLPTEQNNFFKNQRKPMSTAKFFVLKSQKIDFCPTVQNRFFKISTDSDSTSKDGPSCIFSSKLVQKDKVIK